jgi:hypothetical protein
MAIAAREGLALGRALVDRGPAVAAEVGPPLGRGTALGRTLHEVEAELGEEERRRALVVEFRATRVVVEQRAAERPGPEVVHDHDLAGLSPQRADIAASRTSSTI